MIKKLFFYLILIMAVAAISGVFLDSAVCRADYDQDEVVYATYFTGVGCPHCAKTDPVVLQELFEEFPRLIVIEYEIYQEQGNASVFNQCCDRINLPAWRKGIPLICVSESPNDILTGDTPILKNIKDKLTTKENNQCALFGKPMSFAELDFNQLPGVPKIWAKDKILIKDGTNPQPANSAALKNLLLSNDLEAALGGLNYQTIDSRPALLSGGKVDFEQAISLSGWIFEWNSNSGAAVPSSNSGQSGSQTGPISGQAAQTANLTWTKIISLALVDAVNPCALAVLVLMLTAIIAYNPRQRSNIILAGLAFIVSVYIMYLLYGLIIIKFLQVIQALTAVRLWLYKILGIAAVILGILNIKDFIQQRGCTAGPCDAPKERPMTEMPLTWRPKVKKAIYGITSPAGAFGVGIFVTLFLLPCTIGPYIIAGGILSSLDIIRSIPPLLLYNLIFVFPMIVIVAIVYLGFRRVEDISSWKEKNIHKLHLVAGAIMLGLGLAMFFGWV